MVEPAATKTFSAIPVLRHLLAFDKSSCYEIFRTTEDLLLGAFNVYCRREPIVPQDLRTEAHSLLTKCLPNLEVGLVEIFKGLNADKRLGAQCCLSGLQFMVDDFKTDHPSSNLEELLKLEIVEDMKEFIETTGDSLTWGPVHLPDLQNVPKSHVWWKNEFEM